MKSERHVDVCIGTGRGHNLLGQQHLSGALTECFRSLNLKHIAVDDPFDASGPNTVCATVASRCKVPAIQLELSTRLLMNGYEEYCFMRVLDALCNLTQQLSAEEPRRVAL